MTLYSKVTLILMFLLGFSVADIDRTYFKTDEEIDKMFPESVQETGAAAQRRKIENYRKQIEECRKMSDSEAIPILGKLIQWLANPGNFLVQERIEAYDLARALLLSIPGHAEYYGNEIKRLTDDEFNVRLKEHTSTRAHYFRTLSELPSVETVKVLGDLLFDERNPYESAIP